MPYAEGKVGSKGRLFDGAIVEESFEQSGAQRVADAHGRYQDAMLRGNVYLAANQAGAAVTNLNATATGFILTNPVGSGKYAVLLQIGFIQTSAAALAANAGVQLAIGTFSLTAVTHTTALIVRNARDGSPGGSVMFADSSSTLPAAPVAIMNIWQPSVSATATTAIPPVVIVDVAGIVAAAPGTSLSLSALSALSGAAHFIWEEVPV